MLRATCPCNPDFVASWISSGLSVSSGARSGRCGPLEAAWGDSAMFTEFVRLLYNSIYTIMYPPSSETANMED